MKSLIPVNLNIKLIVLHICAQNEKSNHLKIVFEAYEKLIITNNQSLNQKEIEEFVTWLVKPNSQNLLAIEISAQKSDIEGINLIYSYYEKYGVILQLRENISNIFHKSSKGREVFPIIYFFEKLKKHYKDQNILNLTNNVGMTPLHYAISFGNKKTADTLLDFGCDINKKDIKGYTALHYAALSGKRFSNLFQVM